MVPTECPQCGRRQVQATQFCDCGYPLFLGQRHDDTVAGRGSARVPGEEPVGGPPITAGGTTQGDLGVTSELPAAPQIFCSLGHGNDRSRTLCATCGQRLRLVVPQPPATLGHGQAGPTRFLRVVIAVAVAAAVLVLGAALLWYFT